MRETDMGSEFKDNWRNRLYVIIFEADTPGGKLFDILLIWSILLSVIAVMLDSMNSVQARYGDYLIAVEWFFTILFTVEYVLRLICSGNPLRYAKSFFGIVDLFAILPTYVSLFLPGSQYLISIRILRILRVFRVLKLVQYMQESQVITQALWASRRKIAVFLFAILTLVIIFGSFMYIIEGEENGFTSIPKSTYWAIVTLTTVGYGDISPKTGMGQVIASLIMVMGYSIIAVPTGIVTAEIAFARKRVIHIVCPECSSEDHAADAKYCKDCGSKL
jgi:voltage-gated potassium channel